MLDQYQGMAFTCWEIETDIPNKKQKTGEEIIDLQSEEVQRQIEMDDAQIYATNDDEIEEDSSVESGSYFALKEYQEWIVDNPEYQRQITNRDVPTKSTQKEQKEMNNEADGNNHSEPKKISSKRHQDVDVESMMV